ncbi:MAG: GNAT family N-acetyltransferase [Oleiphilaceae bacterium]|nr:GNAT family N-acetyltransferase [Oleiphilaceae bacterium]
MALIRISRHSLAQAEPAMLQQVQQLITKQGGEVAREINEWLTRHQHAERNSIIFCFYSQDRMIGFCLGELFAQKANLEHLLIDKSNQSKGIGRHMMYGMFRQLMQKGIDSVSLNSTDRQLDWLEAHGFIALESSNSANRVRPHLLMNPCLQHYMQTRPKTGESASDASTHMRLGKDASTHRIATEEMAMSHHRSMLLQARRRIWLMANNINNPVLMQAETADAIVQLIKRNPQANVRLLVNDDRQGAGYFNPTLQAMQKLSSYCEIRTLYKTGQQLKSLHTIVDFDGTIQRENLEDWRGQACYDSRLLSNRLSQNYDQIWQMARPSMELRRLAL